MRVHISGRWQLDIRTQPSSEAMSADLAQHLPHRLRVGRVLVVTDNPPVFLSVIRKRWMKLLYDVEKQRASTLDRHKRAMLNAEIARLAGHQFTSKARLAHKADALFITPDKLGHYPRQFATIFITIPLTPVQIEACIAQLQAGGLLTSYVERLALPDLPNTV